MAKRLPAKFDEKAALALKLISEGASVRGACTEVGIAKGTLIDNVDAAQYARAREEGFMAQADELMEWEYKLLNGELDPNAARVAIDARKWRLGKMSKFLGDRPEQNQVNIQNNVMPLSPAEVVRQILAED